MAITQERLTACKNYMRVDFDEEDALSKGMTALRRGEFRTAAEVFDFILAKDPHDFLALRGRNARHAQRKLHVLLGAHHGEPGGAVSHNT